MNRGQDIKVSKYTLISSGAYADFIEDLEDKMLDGELNPREWGRQKREFEDTHRKARKSLTNRLYRQKQKEPTDEVIQDIIELENTLSGGYSFTERLMYDRAVA